MGVISVTLNPIIIFSKKKCTPLFSELLPKNPLFFFHTEAGNPHFLAARVDLDAPYRRSVVCDRRVAGRGADECALRVVHLGAALPRKVVETSWGW